MNTPAPFIALGAVVLLSVAPGPIVRASAPGAAAAVEKPFRLFEGCDLAANVDGKYHPLVGATSRAFVVSLGSKTRDIPVGDAKDVRITPRLKLANTTAEITGATGVLSSDAARQAQFQAMQSAMAVAAESDAARDRAQGEFMRGDMAAASAMRTATHNTGPRDDPGQQANGPSFGERLYAQAREQQGNSYQAAQHLASQMQSVAQDIQMRAATAEPNNGQGVVITPDVTAASATLQAQPAGGASSDGNPASGAGGRVKAAALPHLVDAGNGVSDRFDLDFQVSSAQRLEKAYAILITDFTVPGRPGQQFRRVTGERIGTIDGKRRKVSLYQTGLPAGFQVTNYRVRLYADDQEVPTNLVENQAALSEDEAYQYILTGYLASHKGQTRPPAAMLMWPKSKLSDNAASLRQPIYVTVDASGKIDSVSTEAEATSPPPPAVTTALQYFRFVPALNKGTPVSGRAKLIVADFVR